MKIVSPVFVLLFFACSQPAPTNTNVATETTTAQTKEYLLSLERKWLTAEFALDTAYLSTLLDSTFISISADHISNKQQDLKGIHDNIGAMRRDSIFLDSLILEDAVVNVYGNTAIVTFIVHTYKKDKGQPIEKRTRFYDVWITSNESWKAVSSQGTPVE